jgi:hypothetical protein
MKFVPTKIADRRDLKAFHRAREVDQPAHWHHQSDPGVLPRMHGHSALRADDGRDIVTNSP